VYKLLFQILNGKKTVSTSMSDLVIYGSGGHNF